VVFSEEDKLLIKVLHQEKGYGAKKVYHPTAPIWIRWIIVWSVLEQRMYRTRIHDVSHLTTRLVESGRSLTRRSLIGRSCSGVHIWGHAFNKEEDTLSIGCKTVDRLSTVKWSCSVVKSILVMCFKC